ncbi:MAG: hypothetical protein H6553_09505 [Chitinophagales bacterium]|nr:hypothetical protein [Chitinophagales bacterium]
MIYYRSDYNDTTTIVANNFDYINISILYDTDSININYDNVKQKTYYTAIDPCRIARNIACESNYAPWLTECTTYYTYILNENDYLAADSIS